MTTTFQNTSETFTVHAPQGPAPLLPDGTSHSPASGQGQARAAAGPSPPSVLLQTPSERQVDSGNCSGPHSCRECWGDAERGASKGDTWVNATCHPPAVWSWANPSSSVSSTERPRGSRPSRTVRWDTHGLTEGLAKSRNSKSNTNSRHLE